jgi:hypothetical protein
MLNPQDLEETYQGYMEDLSRYVPDGIYEIDLAFLHELGLLTTEETEDEEAELSYSFYVLESAEKLTLYNQKFIVWIVPQMVDITPTTFTLIALNDGEKPHLEMVFTTSGVYNHSNLVLKILEKFLEEIEENEQEIYNLKEQT